jgi:hypothetical protein
MDFEFLARSYKEEKKESVKNALVNYAIRFSGPVILLTARRVRYGV